MVALGPFHEVTDDEPLFGGRTDMVSADTPLILVPYGKHPDDWTDHDANLQVPHLR